MYKQWELPPTEAIQMFGLGSYRGKYSNITHINANKHTNFSGAQRTEKPKIDCLKVKVHLHCNNFRPLTFVHRKYLFFSLGRGTNRLWEIQLYEYTLWPKIETLSIVSIQFNLISIQNCWQLCFTLFNQRIFQCKCTGNLIF